MKWLPWSCHSHTTQFLAVFTVLGGVPNLVESIPLSVLIAEPIDTTKLPRCGVQAATFAARRCALMLGGRGGSVVMQEAYHLRSCIMKCACRKSFMDSQHFSFYQASFYCSHSVTPNVRSASCLLRCFNSCNLISKPSGPVRAPLSLSKTSTATFL